MAAQFHMEPPTISPMEDPNAPSNPVGPIVHGTNWGQAVTYASLSAIMGYLMLTTTAPLMTFIAILGFLQARRQIWKHIPDGSPDETTVAKTVLNGLIGLSVILSFVALGIWQAWRSSGTPTAPEIWACCTFLAQALRGKYLIKTVYTGF